MNDEHQIQQQIQIDAMKFKCNLMRNNSGALKDATGRLVRYGLGNISKVHNDRLKSSDLIGITKVVITQEMVGKTIGVFTAVECKKEAWQEGKTLDKREIAQKNFIEWVKSMGGLAGFANSFDSLKNIIGQ